MPKNALTLLKNTYVGKLFHDTSYKDWRGNRPRIILIEEIRHTSLGILYMKAYDLAKQEECTIGFGDVSLEPLVPISRPRLTSDQAQILAFREMQRRKESQLAAEVAS